MALVEAGADADGSVTTGMDSDSKKQKKGVFSPLHAAAFHGRADLCRALIVRCGAKVHAATRIKRATPAHFACVSVAGDERGASALRTLLSLGQCSLCAGSVWYTVQSSPVQSSPVQYLLCCAVLAVHCWTWTCALRASLTKPDLRRACTLQVIALGLLTRTDKRSPTTLPEPATSRALQSSPTPLTHVPRKQGGVATTGALLVVLATTSSS